MQAWIDALLATLALPQYGLGTLFVVSFISATLLPLGSEPALFGLLQKLGGIPERDMFNTFNMGVGMILTVAAKDADKALAILHAHGGPEAYRLGTIAAGEGVELC